MTRKTRRFVRWVEGFVGFYAALFGAIAALGGNPFGLAALVIGVLMIASAAEGLTRFDEY